MKIDKAEHQQFLLEVIRQVNIPGALLDLAHEVKQALQCAEIGAAAPDGE